MKETTDHTPNSLLARRTSRATKLEPAGIKRKDHQVGQGGGRRGGARRATIARKPRRRVHCASQARNVGLLRRHAPATGPRSADRSKQRVTSRVALSQLINNEVTTEHYVSDYKE